MLNPLSNICITLVATTHPGNIGAAARAIKTMGLEQLCLVNPKSFPHAQASQRSAGAEDVLDNALVYSSLDKAIDDATIVLGASVRRREVNWPMLEPDQAASMLYDHFQLNPANKAVVLFGREDRGLTNEELETCRAQICIDSNPEYGSLNLASAVQIISYEIRKRFLREQNLEGYESSQSSLAQRQRAATQSEKEGHLKHLQAVLQALNFAHNENSPLLMRKLTRLYNKADLSLEEVHILRGILTAQQKSLDLKGG